MTDETKEELQKTMDKLIDEYNETISQWNELSIDAEKIRKQGLSLAMQMKGEDNKSARNSLHLHALGLKNDMDKRLKKMKLLTCTNKDRMDKLLSLNQKAKKLGFSYKFPKEWKNSFLNFDAWTF